MDVPAEAAPNEEHFGPEALDLGYECGTDGPRVILVGLDGGSTSAHAAAYACGVARRQRCQLVVVFVAAPSSFGAVLAGAAAAQAEAYLELADELRREVRRTADEFGVPTTFVVRRGDAYVELRDAADRMHADMVVVGVSTRAGRRFIGSIATRLARLGRWPVVIVP